MSQVTPESDSLGGLLRRMIFSAVRHNKFLTCLMAILVLFTIGLIIYTIKEEKKVSSITENILGVERVFYHERGLYSLLVNQGYSRELVFIKVPDFPLCYESKVKVVGDVSSNNGIWAQKTMRLVNGREVCVSTYDIHIHSAQDIQGGSWDHGKHKNGDSHGQTLIVE
jgi:hypothetical protein